MNPTDPDQLPNPTFDPVRRAAIVEDVLRATPTSHRRPWVLPLTAAAAVTTIAVGGAAVLGGNDGASPDRASAPAASPSASVTAAPAAPAPVAFTLGAPSAAKTQAALERCTTDFDHQPEAFRAIYAQRVQYDSYRDVVVVVRDDATGIELRCSRDQQSRIGGPLSKSVVTEPTTAQPITVADGGGYAMSTDLASGQIETLDTESLYRVAPSVSHIDMRVGTASAPGTWHRAKAADGFIAVGAWLDDKVSGGTGLFVETRAFDVNGNAITGAPLGRHAIEMEPQP